MDSLPNLRHLRAVTEIVHSGGLRKAAPKLNLSQPAISQALANLNRLLGERLFESGPAGMVPTEAGRIFAGRVERAFDQLRQGAQVLPPRRRSALERHATAAHLRALLAVVEHESFSDAARAIGVAQPTMHRAARDFESLCGLTLFRPLRQGVEPTPEARHLARHIAVFAAELTQARDEIRESAGQMTGRVSIGCLPLLRGDHLPAAVMRLLDLYPEAQISIVDGSYDELLDRLRHGRIDMILGALRVPPPTGIRQEALFSDPLSVVVRKGHPILKFRTLNASRLANHDWIAPRIGTPARQRFTAFFAKNSVSLPHRIIECSSLVATRGLLLRSDRIALLSAIQVRVEVEAGLLSVLPIRLPETERPIGFATRAGWLPTQIQRAFIGSLRDLDDRSTDLDGA